MSNDQRECIETKRRIETYANDERLVITEAVIDALSYHALFGNEQTRYASTSGAWSDTTKQMIWIAAQALPKASGKVVLAYDNDKEGDKYRRATHKILKGRIDKHSIS